ncbi:RHS repeat domain-containing protein [Paraflavitalea pollutisoli]|uniref:RHS repeat domain-containing protein n=1 Tax=Paraflavitalea pollutisoli TaxID=3034143 RepID=UPI0023EBE3E2|nr:RHS repeat-associated core domain-containing protein [Paraflavitalea sp. H1-2-19X]
MKTIPPAGVDLSKFSWATNYSDSVRKAVRNKQILTPKHQLPIDYRYNTLNQVVMQKSPDGGTSRFWYDRLGRLAVSQNAKQQAASGTEEGRECSYTQYDSLGRITQVGQMKNTAANGAMTNALSRDTAQLKAWLLALMNRREQVTRTVYDQRYFTFADTLNLRDIVYQRNLRNRVSYVNYAELPGMADVFDNATYYSYDILGNVDTLLQDYGHSASRPNMMNKNNNRYKKIVYQYDLVSGKVNMVQYQPGWSDMWIHRYSYDAENRLTLVETSNDSLVWEKDARYEYYRHGPLARTVLGDQLVQGVDYAYTLQGWLKGMNSNSYLHDMGGDSKNGGVNKYVARDALGYSLNYFNGEYKPIGAGVAPFPGYRGEAGNAMPDAEYRPLYDGNISSALYNIRKFELNSHVPAFYNYRYDQLNRYKGQDGYFNYNASTNSFGNWGKVWTYNEQVSYDANGNIQRLDRHDINPTPWTGQGIIDSLANEYYPGTNQLRRVVDKVPNWAYGNNSWEVPDIDNQDSLNNYKYDAIGKLVKDESEKNMAIKWNVYGKITEIKRNASITDNNTTFWLKYQYDAGGNRIGKVQKWYNKDSSRYQLDYTWYVRDAQGNLISTYVADTPDTSGNKLDTLFVQFTDQQIYGSSRLGSLSVKTNVDGGPIYRYAHTDYGDRYLRGWRQYELSNHLGNVLTTISDKKIGVSSGPVGSLIDYYEPDMVNAQDYYPFGMVSRYNAGNSDQQYRFGFNGKENDNEVKGGIGSQQDYGMRVYDPRLGRFLSLDPLSPEFPFYTPYQFASNMPIKATDIDGLESSEIVNESERSSLGQKGFIDLSKYTLAPIETKGKAGLDKVGAVVHNWLTSPLINLGINSLDAILNPGWAFQNAVDGIGIGLINLKLWDRNNPDKVQGVLNLFGEAGNYAEKNWDNPEVHQQTASSIWGFFLPIASQKFVAPFKAKAPSVPLGLTADEYAMDAAVRESMKPSKSQIDHTLSAMLAGDFATVGRVGGPYPKDLHPDLNLPPISLTNKPAINCAEPKALNTALYLGAKRGQISYATYRITPSPQYELVYPFGVLKFRGGGQFEKRRHVKIVKLLFWD